MVSSIFQTSRGSTVAPADTVNRAGGKAYSLTPKQALAQYAVTGSFGDVFYADAEEQLKEVAELAAKCPTHFVAQCAVYARARGHMKDMPAYLLAHLTTRGPEGLVALRAAWSHVIDNGKMLRNFVQIVRSGAVGRKSMGTAVKRLVQSWLNARSPAALFRDNVGDKPSITDVIKMVHPKPVDETRKALFGYLIEKEHNIEHLPQLVLMYEQFKKAQAGRGTGADAFDKEVLGELTVPDVPFQMLDSLGLSTEQWKAVADKAGWQMTRMNLNTFKRHGVLDDKAMVKKLAARLRDPAEVAKARVFPYQLMMAFKAASDIPYELSEALQDAMEHAVANVPAFGDNVVVALDVSGSMHSPVTGVRKGATSKVTCSDAAAMFAAAIVRKNPGSRILAFSDNLQEVKVNPRDSVATITSTLARLPSGGTDCSLPMRHLNEKGLKADMVIYLSDSESWLDSQNHGYRSPMAPTRLSTEWARFKQKNKNAKLVCVDLSPNTTTQATSGVDRLNVGGFSDAVFDVIATFADKPSVDSWVEKISEVTL